MRSRITVDFVSDELSVVPANTVRVRVNLHTSSDTVSMSGDSAEALKLWLADPARRWLILQTPIGERWYNAMHIVGIEFIPGGT